MMAPYDNAYADIAYQAEAAPKDTREQVLARFVAEASALPEALRRMADQYKRACRREPARAAGYMDMGAERMNDAYRQAAAGSAKMLRDMKADGINAWDLASAADLFARTAITFRALAT